MSGRYVRLSPGRYALAVDAGEGPAGVQREDDDGVRVNVDGGRVEFDIAGGEEVYFWWRGPTARPGVRLLGASGGVDPEERADLWPTGTTG
jgi:hypothetical protein